ncbi:MAG: ABC transporter ATP-binding protein [Acidimicrobiales bacterium]|nr:ABC transporter ATP-binding protein [Acidimicrobiales bacterium]
MNRRRSVSTLEPRLQSDSAHLLEVRDLKTHFITPLGRVRAVDGVSFDLERGKTLGIVGESGSGKTVLSRSVMNLLPRSNVVRDGSVVFEGRDITRLSPKAMRDIWGIEVAMVFQDPMTSLNPVVKVGRQITESLRFHLDLNKQEARDTAIALLHSVNIPEPEKRIDEYPHQLSGGMRQRVTIAIALACGPKLLMADEPTTALDVTVQAQILELLARQQRERDMGMVLVTHDLGVVAGRTDEIIVMYGGKVVEKAPTPVLFAHMRMPYTEALLNSIPRLESRSHTRLKVIGGRPPDLINPPKGCTFSPRCPYAQPKCHEEEPPLVEADSPGHQFACWFPVGTPENRAAFERNIEVGLPQTLVTLEENPTEASHGR